MDPVLRSPFGDATGPTFSDDELLLHFGDGATAGSSPSFHIEGATLMAAIDDPLVLRLERRSFLVRVDPHEDVAHLRGVVEAGLRAQELTCLDEATLLAAPVALQIVGLRLSTWDLWGDDVDFAFLALRHAARGDESAPVFVASSDESMEP